MFNQFNPTAQHTPAAELVPNNTLAFCMVKVQGLKMSQSTGGRYASLELTIDRGPFERRKVFSMVGDPTDSNNSEKYRQMSLAALQHMLEAAGIFNPADPNSYAAFANASFDQVMAALDGRTVAIKIKIEKGTGGYEDKNAVADWLSPNPASRTFKKWQELLSPAPTAHSAVAHGVVGNPGPGYAGGTQFAAPAAPAAPAPAAGQGGVPAWLAGQ